MRTLLIDADIEAFAYSSANQKTIYFDGRENPPAISADFDSAKEGVLRQIEKYREQLGATDVVVCLSDPDANFRKEIFPAYKGHRDYTNRPVYLQQLKDWFKSPDSGFKTYQRPTLEADDCMGILATHPTLIRGEKIIVSADKDMQTIPGLLFNPNKDRKPRKITKLQADRFHLYQTIIGDSTDGYPGARGVGPKSEEAQSVLTARTVAEMWAHVLAAFKRAKRKPGDLEPEDQALVMARCARILRSSEWDFATKSPRMWMPHGMPFTIPDKFERERDQSYRMFNRDSA
jgi:5''-3'' exonuclease (including N-terminal domain of PolI)